MGTKNLPVIGSNELVEICGLKNVPAKIDTGADSSAVWASDIRVTEDGELEFKLFDKKSPFYTGEIIRRTDYKAVVVKSSNGAEQIRFRTHLTLKIAGKTIRALFNLSDRSKNHFPILIGRRTISQKFLVDVSKVATSRKDATKTRSLNEELKKNPYEFYQKYVKLTGKGTK